jgi:hypothetical protein
MGIFLSASFYEYIPRIALMLSGNPRDKLQSGLTGVKSRRYSDNTANSLITGTAFEGPRDG